MISSNSISSLKKLIEKQNYTRLRIGVIEDPHVKREVRDDGTLKNFDPLLAKSTTQEGLPYPNGLNIINTLSGTVSVKWLDGDGVGAQLPQGFEVEVGEETTLSEEQLKNILEPVLLSSSGLWGGLNPGTGLLTVCGYEFIPPVGSVVLVGFVVGGRPAILGYILPNYITLFNSSNSQYEPLRPGEIRFSSFGGSYIYFSNEADNSQSDAEAQVSNIVVKHTLGGSLTWSSIRGDLNGTFKVSHPTGAVLYIDDFGNISFEQAAIPNFNNPSIAEQIASRIQLLRNGAINLISAMDVYVKAFSSIVLTAMNQFRISTKDFLISSTEDTEINLNRAKVQLTGVSSLKATSDVKLTFQSGFTIECYGGLNFKAKGGFSLIQEGEVTVASKGSFATIIGVGGEAFVGGIVTSHTVCPVGGFHFGAIGNTSRAGNVISAAGVPVL